MSSKKLPEIVAILLLDIIVLAAMQPMSAQAEPFAYIANSGDDTVSVIDTATNTVAATIDVGEYPYGVAVHPDGATVYVTNNYDASVSVIDAATNAVTTTITVGGGPVYGLAVTPDGSYLYVAIGYSGVAVIDTSTNAVVHNITGMGLTIGIAVHPDGSTVYVSSAEMGLYIIDRKTNTVAKNIFEIGWCDHIAAHPGGFTLYLSCYYPNPGEDFELNLFVLDTLTLEVTSRIEGVGSGIAVHPDGSSVYVFGPYPGLDTVTVIDAATNTVTNTIAISSGGYGIGVHPEGSKLYVVNKDNDNVSVIDVGTHEVLREIAVGVQPQGFGLFIGPSALNPIAVTIDDVIDYFDQSVAAGGLIGTGNVPRLQKMRLKTMKSFLLNAKKFIIQKRFNRACDPLNSAYLACDSQKNPIDLVTGADSSELNAMISKLMLKLQCD